MIATVLDAVAVVLALALLGLFLATTAMIAMAVVWQVASLIMMVSSAGKPRVYTHPEPKVASPVDQ